MTDFKNGQELLEVCKKKRCPISEVMKQREIEGTSSTKKEVEDKMQKSPRHHERVSKKAIGRPETVHERTDRRGGKADYRIQRERDKCLRNVYEQTDRLQHGGSGSQRFDGGHRCGIRTAGSSVWFGVLLALQEEKGFSDEQMTDALFHTAAIGYLLMRNASVAGAEAGCQAEVGAASAMAAAAVTELMGGTPEMCLQAAAMAISNLLGLVCDPVAGLVEVPCQSRNAIGAVNAVTCAEITLSGVMYPIPFDEMVDAMYKVGKSIPFELRETAIGGCAGTPTGCGMRCRI